MTDSAILLYTGVAMLWIIVIALYTAGPLSRTRSGQGVQRFYTHAFVRPFDKVWTWLVWRLYAVKPGKNRGDW